MADVVIIGGGVIGLSIAREISKSGREIIVLEKNDRAGDNFIPKFRRYSCRDLLS